MTENIFYKLGEFISLSANRVHPEDYEFHKGAASVFETEEYGPIGRQVAGLLYNVMDIGGRSHTAPAQHLYLLSKQASWIPEFTEVIETALSSLKDNNDLELVKHAGIGQMGTILGLPPKAFKTLLIASALTGAGASTLNWSIGRHIKEDESDIEAMKAQITEYDRLSKQLEDSLRRKYQYAK